MPKAHRITVTAAGPTVWDLRVPLIDGQREFLFRSDVHRDHPCSDRDMELLHLCRARANRSVIADNGDLFDAMQGPHDSRAAKGEGDPDDNKPDYYDRIVTRADEAYAEYIENWAICAAGNHETSVLRHSATDLTARLVAAFRRRGAPTVQAGYRSYLRVTFTEGKHEWRTLIYMHHGSGGAAPVTEGVIQTKRRAVYLTDPDIVVTGHTHAGWTVPVIRERVSIDGRSRHLQWHLQVPGYKDVLASRDMGYEIEKEFAPRPVGAIFVRFHVANDRLRCNPEMAFE